MSCQGDVNYSSPTEYREFYYLHLYSTVFAAGSACTRVCEQPLECR